MAKHTAFVYSAIPIGMGNIAKVWIYDPST